MMIEYTNDQTPASPYAKVFMGLWGIAALVIMGFSPMRESTDVPTYREELAQWHKQRIESLRSETGWLNLAGLFWLKPGLNTAGSDPGNDLTFPAGKSPESLGTFRLTGETVTFEAASAVAVHQADGQPVLAEQTLFGPELPRPLTLSYGSLRWFVIKRGDRYAIRLRDLDSPLLGTFRGIDRYEPNETYRVQARLEQPTTPRTIPILDVTGQTAQQPLVGTLVFSLGGKTHRLDAVAEGPDKLFILFADATNQHDTYGSGRFLYAARPGPDGLTTLDFNRAINPPCAFTPFATCPIPPKQNRLTLAIKAGEKRYGTH
jgi:uncharacterized protein